MAKTFRLKPLCLWFLVATITACSQDSKSTGSNNDTPTPGTTSTPGTTGGGSGTTTTTPTSPTSSTFTATVRVLDVDRLPVSGATFVSANARFTADANGIITIPDVPVVGAVAGTVTNANFMALPVKISAGSALSQTLDVTLSRPELAVSFSAQAPAAVELHAGKIAFSANAFVQVSDTSGSHFMSLLDTNGSVAVAFNGNVSITAKSLSPATEVFQTYSTSAAFGVRTDFDTASVPAGAGRVYLADGTAVNAFPEASMQLNVTDGNGNPLALQDGTPATVRLPLTSFTAHTLGEILPLLLYDPNSDAWLQNGNCTVQVGLGADALECVGTTTLLGTMGVPAKETTAGFPCANFNVTIAGDLRATNVVTWVEEIYTAASTPKSRNTAWNTDGTLCYVGGASQLRVKAQATINGNTTTFSSDVSTPDLVVQAAQDLMEFNAGDNAHACFRCQETSIAFGQSQAQVAADKDGDGYYVYADSTIGNADCNDNDPTTHPGAPESACDHADKNCDGISPPGAVSAPAAPASDANAAIWNNVYCKLACAVRTTEVGGNNIDENCDGIVSDRDADGFFTVGDPAYGAAKRVGIKSDCDDANAAINPNAYEVAGNSADEDCDGYAVDVDGDGQLSTSQSGVNLQNVQGLVAVSSDALRFADCADWDPNVYFGAAVAGRESVLKRFYVADATGAVHRSQALCQYIGADGTLNALGKQLLVDVNCDGVYTDLDGDGYTASGDLTLGDANDVDCNDFDPRVATQSDCRVDASLALSDGGLCAPGGAAISATCQPGYTPNHATGACQDINECAGTSAPCKANQSCVNTPGSFLCVTTQQPLVTGPWTLSAAGANTLQAKFACASGGRGGIYYSLYVRPGEFVGANTAAQVALQANVVTRSDLCGTPLSWDEANPNTLYGAALVATDGNGTSALYIPQQVKTPPIPTPSPTPTPTPTVIPAPTPTPTPTPTPMPSLQPPQITGTTATSSTITVQFSAASGGAASTGAAATYQYAVFAVPGDFGNANILSYVTTTNPNAQTQSAGSVTLGNLVKSSQYAFVVSATDANKNVAASYVWVTVTHGTATGKQFFAVSTGGNVIGGIRGADALCNSHLPKGVQSAKAVISDGSARIACKASNCAAGGPSENVDWALQPNVTYVSSEAETVGTTNAAGIFNFNLSAPPVWNGGEWFSGMSNDWTYSGNACQAWSDNTGADVGSVGQLGNTDGSFLYVYEQSCNRPDSVLCAEQ